jgi:hypothetical protein
LVVYLFFFIFLQPFYFDNFYWIFQKKIFCLSQIL